MSSHKFDIPVVRHETDVLIVGGGAAGTMAAFECARAGVESHPGHQRPRDQWHYDCGARRIRRRHGQR